MAINYLSTSPSVRKTLLNSMMGTDPVFQPTDPNGTQVPPDYGANFNPALGVTASSILSPTQGVTASGGTSAPPPPTSAAAPSSNLPTLPDNYNFNDLAKYEEAARNAYGQNASADILKTRDSLATSLNDYGQKFFANENPAILEDLNARGLFSSPTAVNTEQAKALKEIALANENYLRDFDTSALSARLQAQQDALDSAQNLRQSGLEANIQEGQAAREEALARDLAKQQSRNSLTNSLIGAGSNLGGSLLLAKSLGAKAASTAVPSFIGAGSGVGEFGGVGVTGVGTPASSLFPEGIGSVGTGVTGTTPTAGIGLGTAAGVTAGAAGGLAAYEGIRKTLANQGVNKNLAKVLGSVPIIGAQVAGVNKVIHALGGGAGHTENGNAIAATAGSLQSQRSQLAQLQDAYKNGQIDQQTYEAKSLPILSNYRNMVEHALTQGSTWASAIRPEWDALQSMGLVKSINGQWVNDTGQAIGLG
jgi:hypothetical protein